jgi:hypothetical protein
MALTKPRHQPVALFCAIRVTQFVYEKKLGRPHKAGDDEQG